MPATPLSVLETRNCNADCDARLTAARIQADGNYAVAAAVEKAVERFGPAADAVAHLGDAQKRLCNFLVGHRLKLAASVPLVLTLVGAISPNAAKGLHDLILAFSAHA